MSLFAAIRYYQNNHLFEQEVAGSAKIISERIANQVTPSIWEIYLRSVNRRFSEEAASAILNSEMNNRFIDAIIVYGRFGHVYMGRVIDENHRIIPYQANEHETLLSNHPIQVDHPIRNGTMTIGKVTVYFNDEPLRLQLEQTVKLDLMQSMLISIFIIAVLFFTIKRVLIGPLKSIEIAKHTFNSLDEGILYVDNDNQVTSVNPAFSTMTGFSQGEVLNQTCNLFSLEYSERRFLDEVETTLQANKSWMGEAHCTGNNRQAFPVYLVASQVVDDEQNKICRVFVFQDISKQKEAEERLKNLAFYDALTGLANRRKFEEHMALEIESCKRAGDKLGLLFIDLDDFKYINDTLGHNNGDDLLVEMSRRFRCRVRESDHIARLGGDEFTIIASHVTSEETLAVLSEDILRLTSQVVTLQGKPFKISATIGISIFPKDGINLEALMKHADCAMYQAKESGKGKFSFYSSELDQKIQHRQKIKASLMHCIENNELYLQYQPKTSLAGQHTVSGAEALVRWHSIEYGLIPPDLFIPIAEENHAIIFIGEWVIKQVFANAARWNGNSNLTTHPITLSINLSSCQLHNQNLLPCIRQQMEEHHVNPDWIEFEITETAIITNFDASVIVLNQLKDMGFSLSLDDFGTGYSSLNYLTKLPVDVLKIDKSFVFNMKQSHRAESVVETILALSKSLGLKTIAEGIESKEHLEALEALGCEYGQGYYFSHPLQAKDFERYLKDEKRTVTTKGIRRQRLH